MYKISRQILRYINIEVYNCTRLKTLNLIYFGFFQLRKTVFDYAQREIAPKAAEIDKTNSFNDLRVIYHYLF